MPIFEPNTADTISVNFRPGQDFRDFPTQSQSVFTFGDYRITRNPSSEFVGGDTSALRFDGYESLSSLNVSGFSRGNSVFVSSRELNLKKKDPCNYAYFQTLKLDIATSLDNVITEWPYAVASIQQESAGVTAYEYTAVTSGETATYCHFKIPYSAVTNQGGVVLNSGSTITGRSLLQDTQDYVIQLSGGTLQDHPQHIISAYTFSAGTYLEFTLDTLLFTGSSSTEQTAAIWIRPTDRILQDFYQKRTPLENHILTSGAWKHQNPMYDSVNDYITTTYTWPKNVDGFNIDINTGSYVTYQNNLLSLAELIDCEKTDIMMRTMVPENYLDLDSADSLYRRTIQTYAHQFDEIKRYIDGISYAHTVEYDGECSVPDKFIFKLAELLGWKLTSGFNELDLLEYLTKEVSATGSSKKEYDLQLWRRIMVNLTWLFKRKGTRDAMQFIFKLIGAPDCMIRIEEFVYDINKAIVTGSTGTLLDLQLNNKINEHGYINYDESPNIFQEGGRGRGNGDKYIDFWRPEFDPIARVDNVKTQTGATIHWGSENVINSKELIVGLDSARAIECDLQEYYTQSGTCWVWGSGDPFQFSNLNVPFEWTIEDCSLVNPPSITGMTLAQWTDFIYKSNVDPRNRKVSDAHNGGYHYHKLREIYMHYYQMTTPDPNQISFGKLEKFLELIEVQFYCAAEQLIPATSILEAFGTIYRNTVFNRQKFVYPEGINAGSEFQLPLPASPENQLYPVRISNTVNDIIEMTGTPVSFQSQVIAEINLDLCHVTIDMGANVNLVQSDIDAFEIEVEVDDFVEDIEIIDG
ncbi:MAG: hypothetical protein P8J32_05570 [bacterium]|nr:hypothetical protein [bacterium]